MLDFVPVALFLLFFISFWFLKRWSVQMKMAQNLRNCFFGVVHELVEDHDVPDVLLDDLQFLAEDIVKPNFIYYLSGVALSGKLRHASKEGLHDAHRRQELLNNCVPEAKRLYFSAVVSFLIATTYNSFLPGSLVRRVILYGYDEDSTRGACARAHNVPEVSEKMMSALLMRENRQACSA